MILSFNICSAGSCSLKGLQSLSFINFLLFCGKPSRSLPLSVGHSSFNDQKATKELRFDGSWSSSSCVRQRENTKRQCSTLCSSGSAPEVHRHPLANTEGTNSNPSVFLCAFQHQCFKVRQCLYTEHFR